MTESYPKNAVCAECGSPIVIHLSKKDTEYACNSDTRNDFHTPCRNWKAKGGQTTLPKKTEPAYEPEPEPEPEPEEEWPRPVFLDSSQSYRIVEVNVGLQRKAGGETIPALPQFENMDFTVQMKVQVESGADIQKIIKQIFAEAAEAIDKQIIETTNKWK